MTSHPAKRLGFDAEEFVFPGQGISRDPTQVGRAKSEGVGPDFPDFLSGFELPSASIPWLSIPPDDDEAAFAKPDHAIGKGASDTKDKGNKGKGGPKDKASDGSDEDSDGGSSDGGSSDGGSSDGGDGGAGDGGSEPTHSTDYVSGLDTPDGFNIALTFSGGWTAALKDAVYQVAESFSDFITGDLPDINGVDDILIDMRLATIDGSGGHAGRATYTALRPDSQIPYSGYVEMDSADAEKLLSNGIFDELVQHEMLHTLGMGTTWKSMGLVETVDGAPRFTGDKAIKAYNEVFSAAAADDPFSADGVPLSPDGFHWNEGVIGREAMTPRIGSNDDVTDLTLAALEDMGYETIYGDDILIA